MSDTPRTDAALCWHRWHERQGEFDRVQCELEYVEPEMARELEREIVALRNALLIARRALTEPFDPPNYDWKGVLQRKALDAIRGALNISA